MILLTRRAKILDRRNFEMTDSSRRIALGHAFLMKSLTLFALALFFFSPITLSAADNEPRGDCNVLRSVDAKSYSATVLSCDKNWQLTWQKLDTSGKPIDGIPSSISANDLYYWGCWRPAATGQQLLLRDGGRVIGFLDSLDAAETAFDSISGFESVKIPTRAVQAIVFQPAAFQKIRKEEDHRRENRQTTARVVLANGDQQSGEIVRWENNKLTFKTSIATLSLDQKNLLAILLPDANEKAQAAAKENATSTSASATSTTPTKVWLGFRDGSRVLARQLELANDKWVIQLTGGGTITAERDVLCAIQPTDGRVRYLSDLEPNGYKHIPWLNTAWEYERDRNVQRDELQSLGRTAIKGIGMHSGRPTELRTRWRVRIARW